MPGAGGDGGAGGTGETDGTGEAGDAAGEPAVRLLDGNMRRLTAAEYAATVRDVLGTQTQPQLTEFTKLVDGFDNNAAANTVDDALYLRYLETAESLADEVMSTPALLAKIVTCEAVDDTTCVTGIIAKTGLRIFRRPLLDAELTAYQKVYERARERSLDHHGALRDVLVALLASAQHVYRIELSPAAPGARPVGPYDMATRLSYLLWSSAPDSVLLDLAAQNQLSDEQQLTQAVDRLLQDARSQRLSASFAGQWLGARALLTRELGEAFPDWTPDVSTAAAAEIEAWFGELTKPDQAFDRFFDSATHFVNVDLAPLYGLTAQTKALARVDLPDAQRHGFLSLVGFLAQDASVAGSYGAARGAFIREQLLCQPANDPSSEAEALGRALEHFDGSGRYRTLDESGQPLTVRVELPGSDALPSAELDGLPALSQALAASPAWRDCVAQKLYTYAFGSFTEAERPNVAALSRAWQSGPMTLRALILQLVLSPEFRQRGDGGKP